MNLAFPDTDLLTCSEASPLLESQPDSTWENLQSDGATISAYFGVSGIPAVAVIKAGKVVWRGHPARISLEMLENWVE